MCNARGSGRRRSAPGSLEDRYFVTPDEEGKTMKRKIGDKIKNGGLIAILIIGLIAVCYGLSWIAACGVIKVITLCFGLSFKWSISTGIWLILCMLQTVFKTTVNSKD